MQKWRPLDQTLSHENKPLNRHISEIKENLIHFLSFFELEKYTKFAFKLAELHDAGKRYKDWELGKKTGHSHWSYQYLLENPDEIQLEEELIPIFNFFVLSHHSIFSKTLGPNLRERKIEIKKEEKHLGNVFDILTFPELEEIVEKYYSQNKEELINLVDVFGLFKFADSLSASNNLSFRLEKPQISEEKVRKLIEKDGKMDKKRWEEQLKLGELSDIAMLRAFTGWGKTTAGLLFFKKKKPSKIFYLMPTITAINKLYEKLRNAFGEKVSKYFYLVDTELKDEDEKISQLIFLENFTTPLVITTIDQFLLSFLQVGKYYTKRIMFRNSGLIIDEIHLLNPLMLHLLIYFLREYQKIYNLKVLFMSATLPNSLVEYISKELNVDRTKGFLDYSEGYKERRRVMWNFINEKIDSWIEKIVEEKNKGKKVLVIVNTVEKAVQIGKILEENFHLYPGKDFLVIHARFMYLHRKEKEEKIDKELSDKPHILVSTQVCEVSLDISYDVLFTELASIPALIQRFGRVNRYNKETNEINVYIFLPDKKDGKKYPYSEKELEDAKRAIIELEGDKLEREIQLLKSLNNLLTLENLLREIEESKKEVKVEYWEKILRFFYSLDTSDEEIRRILGYREGVNILVIPHPSCVNDEETRVYVEDLISSKITGSFLEREKKIAKLKEVAVPIPIWWIKGLEIEKEKAFPVMIFKDKIYNKEYGFYDIRLEKAVI
jgi:CRISPR-associated endonuclease/helicase Cas3